jgi:hypothetical protein
MGPTRFHLGYSNRLPRPRLKLGLNGDQKQRFEALHTRYVQQRFDLDRSLRGKSRAGAARTLRAQLATIDRQEDQELTAILSPQQLAQFQALRQQNREQLRARLKEARS